MNSLPPASASVAARRPIVTLLPAAAGASRPVGKYPIIPEFHTRDSIRVIRPLPQALHGLESPGSVKLSINSETAPHWAH